MKLWPIITSWRKGRSRPRYQMHLSKGTTYNSKRGALLEIFAHSGSTVYAYGNAIVWAADGATVYAYPGAVVHASPRSLILSLPQPQG
jgi:hypothetical protein